MISSPLAQGKVYLFGKWSSVPPPSTHLKPSEGPQANKHVFSINYHCSREAAEKLKYVNYGARLSN